MKYNRVKEASRNMFYGMINRTICILGPFIIRSLMINYMGAEFLGLDSLFKSVLQVLNLAELGLSSAITFSMYDPIARNDNDCVCALLNFYRRAYLIIGIVISFFGLALVPMLPYLINGDIPSNLNLYVLYFLYILNIVLSYFMFGYKESILVAHQRSDISNNIMSVANILLYLMQISAIIYLKSYYAYIIVILISTIFSNIITGYITDKKFPQIRCRGELIDAQKKDLYKRISGLMLYKISQVCRNSFDSIILSAYLGLTAVAKYHNYYYIMNGIAVFFSVMANSIMAGIGNSIAVESIEKNYNDLKRLYLLYNWLAGWCTACLLCLYQDFMEVWVGKEYLLSDGMVILFCVYFYSLRVGDIAAIYRQSAGLWWEDRFRPIIESVANLTLNIFMVKFWGMVGVIISTIVTVIAINIPWASYVLFKYYFRKDVRIYWKRIVINSLVVFIACLVTKIFSNFVGETGINALALKGMICLFLPNIVLYFIYFKTTEFKQAKRLVIKMLKLLPAPK